MWPQLQHQYLLQQVGLLAEYLQPSSQEHCRCKLPCITRWN
jgi:hypothetical protein